MPKLARTVGGTEHSRDPRVRTRPRRRVESRVHAGLARGVRDSRPVGGLCRRGFVAAGPGIGVDTTAGADATDREGGLGNDAEHASPARGGRCPPARSGGVAIFHGGEIPNAGADQLPPPPPPKPTQTTVNSVGTQCQEVTHPGRLPSPPQHLPTGDW